MKRPWYYRMLLSYLPIFFFISSFLIFIFFQELSSQSKREAIKANSVLNLLAMDKVEHSLSAIDYAMVDFSLNNKVLNRFFQSDKKDNVVLNREVLKEIEAFKRLNPLVDSVYLFRARDRVVLTERYMFPLDEFADKAYIREVAHAREPMKWTKPHLYQEFEKSTPRYVVTLARVHFTPLGERCLIVVNVKVDALRSLLEQTYNPDVSFVSITASDGTVILGDDDGEDNRQVLSRNTSAYLDWTFSSGLVNGTFSKIAFQASRFWMLLGAVIVVLGLIAIVIVTRRNYRPIEQVVAQIQSMASNRADKVKAFNEFRMIESVIENLKRQSTLSKQQQREVMSLRSKHFLYETIEGVRHISDDEWTDEMVRLELPLAVHSLQVVAVEIDRYADFCGKFSRRDQLLLMYALHNSATETFNRHALAIWGEWVTSTRLVCVIFQSAKHRAEQTGRACEELLDWVSAYLPMTVTIGVGSSVTHHHQIAASYQEAQQAISYKFFKGLGKVIAFGEACMRQGAELFTYLQTIRVLARDFRTGAPEWSDTFHQLFRDIRSDRLTAEDAVSLLNYMVFQLDRAIGDLAPEYRKLWKEKGHTALTDALDAAETLEEVQLRFFSILYELRELIGNAMEANRRHRVMLEVRNYIENHFTDADMSLDRLKDRFGLSQKYLSQMFKDQFGEGFMDFLIRLRIDYAKTLLTTTSEPIQTIAERSGYTNVISFTRAFKKVTSRSPGDYRKQALSASQKAEAKRNEA